MKLLVILAILGSIAAGKVRKISFEGVESEAGQKVVMFVGEPDAEDTKALISQLEEISEFGPSFEYVYVECGHEDSKEKCAGASFNKFPRFFTNSAEGGIESLGTAEDPPSTEDIFDHLKFRMESVKGSKVIAYTTTAKLNELAEEKPVLVKFHQLWCGHCKKLKKHFQKASTYDFVKDKAYFVDVDCGKHKGICGAEGINSYPTLKVWQDGGKKVSKDDSTPRSHKEMAVFMQQVADGEKELTGTDVRSEPVTAEDEPSTDEDNDEEPATRDDSNSVASAVQSQMTKVAEVQVQILDEIKALREEVAALKKARKTGGHDEL